MNTRSANDAKRRRYYAALIAKQAKSSLSVADFCKRNGISPWTFYQWRKQLSACNCRKPSQPAFLPLSATDVPSMQTTASSSKAEVVLDSRIRLHIPADYPLQSARAILSILLER
jgi:transposase-like protein